MKNIVCCDDYADLKKKSFVSLETRRHIALSLSRMYEVTSSIVTPSWTSCQFITGYTTLPPLPPPSPEFRQVSLTFSVPISLSHCTNQIIK